MQALKDKICSEGCALNDQVLLVDSFLNHQVDAALMAEIGREFARLSADLGVTRVMTIESSGIAPAQMTALSMNLPLVVMKKSSSRILSEGTLQTEVFSFTKGISYQLTVKNKYIHPNDRVLLSDEFLANGEAARGAIRLIEEAGASVTAIGIVIEKSFQPGRALLEEAGYKIMSLARIESLAGGEVHFA